jgi:hypothetical protein
MELAFAVTLAAMIAMTPIARITSSAITTTVSEV